MEGVQTHDRGCDPTSRIRMRTSRPIGGRKLLLAPWLLGAVLLIDPDVSQAQARLLPSVGLYVPASDLGEVTGGGVEGTIELGRTQSTLALGLAGELGSRQSLMALRLGATYGTRSEVPIGGVGCTTCSARSSLLVLDLAVALRPIPRLILVQPYFLLGGGIKRYDFELRNFSQVGLEGILSDQTRGAAQLGLGADFALGPVDLFSEINTHLSRVETAADGSEFDSGSDLQTDLVFSVGLILGD